MVFSFISNRLNPYDLQGCRSGHEIKARKPIEIQEKSFISAFRRTSGKAGRKAPARRRGLLEKGGDGFFPADPADSLPDQRGDAQALDAGRCADGLGGADTVADDKLADFRC